MTTPDITLALRIAPDILGELRTKTIPEKRQSERSAPGFKPTTPLAVSPVDDADNLYAILIEHADAIADILGTRRPHVQAWSNSTRYLGLVPDTAPESAFRDARTLCRFIEHQLPMIQDDDLIRDIENDITTNVFRLDNRYPATAPKEHVKARCANCERLTLYKYPARSFGADETFVCATCGKWHTEPEVLERRAAREREVKERRKKAS